LILFKKRISGLASRIFRVEMEPEIKNDLVLLVVTGSGDG